MIRTQSQAAQDELQRRMVMAAAAANQWTQAEDPMDDPDRPRLYNPDNPPSISSVAAIEGNVPDVPASTGPELPTPAPIVPAHTPTPMRQPQPPDPRIAARRGVVNDRLDEMSQPASLSDKINKTVMALSPLLARAVGGSAYGGGYAEGAAKAEHTMHDRQEAEKKLLIGENESLAGIQERGREADTRNLQAAAQLEATRAWHEATVGVQGRRVDATAHNYDQQHIDRMRKQGLNADGSPIPEEQLSPQERATVAKTRAASDVAQARIELTKAQTSAIPEKIKIAQQQLQVALSRLSMAQQGLQLRNRTFERDTYGTDMGVPVPGAPTMDGKPVGTKFANAVNPTSATKGAGEQGDIIIQAGNQAKALIDKHKSKLGNMSAVLNSVFNNAPWADKQSSELISSLRSYIALQPRLHGFRGQSALQEFSKIVGGLPKDPEALKAAIDGIAGTAGIVAERGRPKLVRPGATREKPAAAGGAGAIDDEPDFIQDTPGGPARRNPKKAPKLRKAAPAAGVR
jgi:hypothetical protein